MPIAPRILVVAWGCAAVSAATLGCYRANPTGDAQARLKPTATASGSAAQPASTAPIAAAKASGSPSATASAVKPAASAAPTADKYVRPAMQRALPSATAEVRSSRSPIRKTAGSAPPPRTRVLEAPSTSGGVLGITFDNLMFPMEKDDPFSESLLTDAVRALFNKRVKIRGFIHPSCPFETGVKNFILVRDDQGCCFGPGALLYDCIIVDMVPGKTTKFSTRPVAVEGILTFREYKDRNGRHEAIFHLDAESVE
ncbi:MAG: hypothetical protein JNL96_07360 [Planctomycetaceae bacterium]|nr:hypothetical protein [Planctomycetaceae bacterium]